MSIKPLILAVLFLGIQTAQAAAVYECTDKSGRTTYTQDGGKNCKTSNLGKAATYTPAPPPRIQTAAVPKSDLEQPHSASSADLDAAREELARAQRALEEGRKIRYGNERNYAKYLERIQGLENQVSAAQERVNVLQGGGY